MPASRPDRSTQVFPPAREPAAPADVVLADGGSVTVRPLGPADTGRLSAFQLRLRAANPHDPDLASATADPALIAERVISPDSRTSAVLGALAGDEVVGIVEYSKIGGGDDARFGILVESAHQGRGLGTLLIDTLIDTAGAGGVRRLVADVPASSRRVLEVLRSVGFDLTPAEGNQIRVNYPVEPGDDSPSGTRARRGRVGGSPDHPDGSRSIDRLLHPRSVAVIGASREPATVGHEVFRRLLRSGFTGAVYPVNAAATHVASVYAYRDLREVPAEIDLAVVAVPAPLVTDVLRACAQKRVRGVIVVSAGFADGGDEGRALLADAIRIARDGGMRLIGPNAMGVINTAPTTRLHATFAVGNPPPGRVGVFTQSGALAGTFLTDAARRAVGLSTFVSAGDRSDVSTNDLLEYWQTDPRTDVIMLHLQSFGNPRRFARIARQLGRHKPVVALKSGQESADSGVDALFTSAGVVRADTLNQLFDAVQLLTHQPLPAGRRVGIVGTSSALAALATDACRTYGLEVPPLSEQTCSGLADLLGHRYSTNPVDLGPLADPERFDAALRLVATSGDVDAIIALVTPHAQVDRLGAAVREVAADSGLPVLASYLGQDGMPAALAVAHAAGSAGRGSVPSYSSPESAALALSRAADHAAWRARDHGRVPALDHIDLDGARAEIARHPKNGTWLPEPAVATLLAGVGLRTWPSARVSDEPQAQAAAAALGWPVALKIADERFRSRLDVGAVQLGLGDPEELSGAWEAVRAAVGPGDMLVQPMAPAGVSTVVGLRQDPTVGPLLSLRLGGAVADLLVDPLARTLPLTDRDAEELIHQIRGSVLLVGGSGAPAADTEALADLLHRVARIAEELPAIGEILLDPVLVGRRGVVLLHAGIRLLPPETESRALLRAFTATT
ncbi:bifunctional acetate--CoA ligase family protein/GNAT family N-acetyltransferase [Frankia gtarii]|uniref:bifunctional acetate--CoA ligase family protein/GNAT family N-acetyltransferase n=1 Tax=Frankia gtarii TaxID=2950102 RepID=UPI0021BFC0B2|nr:bifunctional GNAT family N-acetyltransferase/acetate--CoA ligase family protein [Frankia gtarii]